MPLNHQIPSDLKAIYSTHQKSFNFFLLITIVVAGSCKKNVEPLQDNWERAIPFQETPAGLVSIRAFDCGICHREIYEEWKLSTHAHAWTDLQFQAELNKESSPYLCINCHIPLENQQEYIVTGLIEGDIYQPVREKNLHFDAALQDEGISCSTCHVRDGYIIGAKGYPNPPHPVKVDTAFLNEQLCMTCHNANAVVTPELVCTFQTGDEWKSGPYYNQKNCISCHMDTISRPLMQGMPNRMAHRHWFPGSGIPKRAGIETKGLSGMAFYPDQLQKQYGADDSITYEIKLVNEEAGHRLPTGDPERFYLIELQWTDIANDTIIQQETFRIGETWEWYPEARKLSDNNLNPKESRVFSITMMPHDPGQYRLKVLVTKHRMDDKTAVYNKLGDEYPLFIEVFSEEQVIEIK